MTRYCLALCATLTLNATQTCATLATRVVHATPILRASNPGTLGVRGILPQRALHRTAQPPAGSAMPEEPVKAAALLLLKQACRYSCVGSAIFFAGHEWGKQKGLENGFGLGEAQATD